MPPAVHGLQLEPNSSSARGLPRWHRASPGVHPKLTWPLGWPPVFANCLAPKEQGASPIFRTGDSSAAWSRAPAEVRPHPRSRGSLSPSVFTFQGGGSQGLGGRGRVCKMNACGLQPPDLRWLVTAATGDSCGWGAERRGSLGSSF